MATQPAGRGPINGNNPTDFIGSKDAWNRDRTAEQVNALGDQVLLPTEVINNDITTPQVVLLSGPRVNLVAKKEGTRITGQPGTIITGTLSVQANDVSIEGIRVQGTLVLSDNIVGVRITNCVFDRSFAVPSGSVIQFIGCTFKQSVTVVSTGTIQVQGGKAYAPYNLAAVSYGHWMMHAFLGACNVANLGVPANAYVIGCVRKSGVAHTNATILGETT